jgi:hypothetical protein
MTALLISGTKKASTLSLTLFALAIILPAFAPFGGSISASTANSFASNLRCKSIGFPPFGLKRETFRRLNRNHLALFKKWYLW